MTDTQLELCKKGDKDAFSDLVKEYQQKVYSTALSIMGNRSDAYDVSQEVFIRIYKSISGFRGASSLSTWIYKITTNICLDTLRKENRFKAVDLGEVSDFVSESSLSSPEKYILSAERKEKIRQALTLLPSDLKTAFVLRDIEGLSYAEISEVTSVPEGTVKSRISRARAAILCEIKKNAELFEKRNV